MYFKKKLPPVLLYPCSDITGLNVNNQGFHSQIHSICQWIYTKAEFLKLKLRLTSARSAFTPRIQHLMFTRESRKKILYQSNSLTGKSLKYYLKLRESKRYFEQIG